MSLDGQNKIPHDLPHQIPHLGSTLITKIVLFASLFSRLKKSEKQLPRLPTNHKKSIPNFVNRDLQEQLFFFAIVSLRKPRFGSPRRQNFESEIDTKMTWNQAKQKTFFKHFCHQKLPSAGPKIIPKSTTILLFTTSTPSCCSHGPEVPK